MGHMQLLAHCLNTVCRCHYSAVRALAPQLSMHGKDACEVSALHATAGGGSPLSAMLSVKLQL